MSSSNFNRRTQVATVVAFFLAILLSIVIGATTALVLKDSTPVCARVPADTPGVVESRDDASILLRIPASNAGVPYRCGGDAE